MHITDWSSDLSSSDLAHADLIARLTAMYADDPLPHPLWDSAVKTQELASDIGGNNGRNGADLGKLAASLMLPADGARVMMVETGGWDTHSGQRGRLKDRKSTRLNSSH